MSSFNRSLDKAHGPACPPIGQPIEASAPRPPRGPSPGQVDSHLTQVLQSPLFTYPTTIPTSNGRLDSLRPPIKTRQPKAIAKCLIDPMDVFQQATDKGIMTVERALACLFATWKLLSQSVPRAELADAMASSGAGTRVIDWLRTSGNDDPLKFISFSNPRPTLDQMRRLDVFVAFLVTEHREKVVWEWYTRLVQARRLRDAGFLIVSLLRSQSLALRHVPYDVVLQASQLAGSDSEVSSGLAPYYYPWRYVAYQCTMNPIHFPQTTRQLFEEFVNLVEPWRKYLRLDLAHLHLYHPTHPSAGQAIDYLEKNRGKVSFENDVYPDPPVSRLQQKQERSKETEPIPGPFAQRVGHMGADATNFFLRRGDRDKATRAYSYLQAFLPPPVMQLFPYGAAEVRYQGAWASGSSTFMGLLAQDLAPPEIAT